MSEAKYGALADRIARRHGLDPRLFRRLISAESGWNPNAVSPAGARGLTQVVPRYHPDANLSTPAGQLEAGASYLQSGIKKYGNVRDALSTYNSGRPWSQGQRIAETRNYVSKITAGYNGSGAGAAPSSPGAPAPGAQQLQQVAGSLDAKRLMMLLNNQRSRSLRGLMPAPGFQGELTKIASQALPRAQVAVAGRQVGAQVATAGQTLGKSVAILPGQAQWGSYGYADPEGQGGHHLAVDWFAKAGTPVRAPQPGRIVRVSPDPSPGRKASGQVFGGTVAIRLDDGRLVVMRHISPAGLRVGTRIPAGAVVGQVKDWSGATHIHLELYRKGSSDREYSAALALNPKELFA
jgi:hypothetical protein